MKKRFCFLDHAATTSIQKQVFSAMMPYFTDKFGNPSSLYCLGRESKEAVTGASQAIASVLGCGADEIFYTGSATEADNLVILGAARANKEKGNRIIVSAVEHKGILSACEALKKEGFEVVKIPVQKNGIINTSELKKQLNEKTVLVSVTMADSETGTIQPISEISDIIRNFRNSKHEARNSKLSDFDIRISDFPYLHTDASQAAAYLDINVKKLGIDMMTLSAHKLGGPKGIGCLYAKRGVKISPLIYGGGQQGTLRSGTENVPAIVGFSESLKLSTQSKKSEFARVKKLRDLLEKGIFKSVPKTVLNGHPDKRMPNFLNVSFLDIEGEALLLRLDEIGIMASTGSACNSQSLEPSYILEALGDPYEYIHGSIRFTLGKNSAKSDIEYALKHLPAVIKNLRSISPLNLKPDQIKKISDPRAFVGGQTPHFLKKKK